LPPTLHTLLKAYSIPESKGFFLYNFFTSLEKLNCPSLPPHNAFSSTLKNANISEKEYEQCQKIWIEKNMKTLKDFLIYYNNLDTKHLLLAIQKSFNFASRYSKIL